jgi:tripartite-type tricarboxylate transporter receptor subunit TctC
MFVTTPPSVIGHVAAGKLKALAYTGKQRHPSLPNDEQGAFAAYMDSQTLAKFVDKELAAWANVIKTAGIKAD